MIDLWDTRVGDIVRLASGRLVVVMSPSEDGEWVLVSVPGQDGVPEVTDLVHVTEVHEAFTSRRN